MILTYKYRVKGKHGLLRSQARAVNIVWNFCNESQKSCIRFGRRWVTGFDLNNLTSGTSKDLGLHSGTIHAVCEQYANSRSQSKRPYLRWRKVKSLGWIPFKGPHIKIKGDSVIFLKTSYRLFLSRPIPHGAKLLDGGSFSEDSLGNWYINIVCDIPNPTPSTRTNGVGIDLGLKTLATLSTGEKVEARHFYRRLERKLASAQRANKKRLARKIHAKIANRRRDFLHKKSTELVKNFGNIVVGNIRPSAIAKSHRFAKSVMDSGWTAFRTLLRYKAIGHGVDYREVSEAFSTQTCSQCGLLGGPKGITGLGKREWRCAYCSAHLDRDINAAQNILRLGHQSPAVGTLS